MAPKKKAAAKDGEEDLFENFLKIYRKQQKDYDTVKLPDVEEIISLIQEEGVDLPAWNLKEDSLDQMSVRVLMYSLFYSGYNKFKALRFWKCACGDESVRSVCFYLDDPRYKVPLTEGVQELQFTDNGITPLGCEFLGKTLGLTGNQCITYLRLDYNKFGSLGLQNLAAGLSQNSSLRYLSLQYCDIDETGGQWMSMILMYIRSALEELRFRGNSLGNNGIVDVFRGARRARKLRVLDLADNKFSETGPGVIEGLLQIFQQNQSVTTYDIRGNHITDTGAETLIHGIIGQNHLKSITFPESCSVRTFEALEQALGGGKKGGKKKKGKKK